MIETVLDFLQRSAEVFVDTADVMLCDRHTSYRKARRSLFYGPREFKHSWSDWYRKRNAFYTLLHRLRKEGLVQSRKKGRIVGWKITRDGLNKYALLKKRMDNPYSLATATFEKTPKRGLVIIVFDIPERERVKRRWLRESLKSLDFTFIQKSVWLSNHELPEDFLQALRDRDLLEYVHIFSVSQRGTITKYES